MIQLKLIASSTDPFDDHAARAMDCFYSCEIEPSPEKVGRLLSNGLDALSQIESALIRSKILLNVTAYFLAKGQLVYAQMFCDHLLQGLCPEIATDEDHLLKLGRLLVELNNYQAVHAVTSLIDDKLFCHNLMAELAVQVRDQTLMDSNIVEILIRYAEQFSELYDRIYVCIALAENSIDEGMEGLGFALLRHADQRLNELEPYPWFNFKIAISTLWLRANEIESAQEIVKQLILAAGQGVLYVWRLLEFTSLLYEVGLEDETKRFLNLAFLSHQTDFTALHLSNKHNRGIRILRFISDHWAAVMRKDSNYNSILDGFIGCDIGTYEQAYLELADLVYHNSGYPLKLSEFYARCNGWPGSHLQLSDFRDYLFVDQRMNPDLVANDFALETFMILAQESKTPKQIGVLHSFFQTCSRFKVLRETFSRFYDEPIPSVSDFSGLDRDTQVLWMQYLGMARSRQALDLICEVLTRQDIEEIGNRTLLVEALWALSEIGIYVSERLADRVKAIAISEAFSWVVRKQAAIALAAMQYSEGKHDAIPILIGLVQDVIEPSPNGSGICDILRTIRRYGGASEQLVDPLQRFLKHPNLEKRADVVREVAYLLADINHERALSLALTLVNGWAFSDFDSEARAHRLAYIGHYHMFLSEPTFWGGRAMMRRKIVNQLTERYLEEGRPLTSPADVFRSKLERADELSRLIKYPIQLPAPTHQSFGVVWRGMGCRGGKIQKEPAILDLLTRGCQSTEILMASKSRAVPWAKQGIVYAAPSLSRALYYASLEDADPNRFAALVAIDGNYLNRTQVRQRVRLQKENSIHVAFFDGVPKHAVRAVFLSDHYQADIEAVRNVENEDELEGVRDGFCSTLLSTTSPLQLVALWHSLRDGMGDKIVFVDLKQAGNTIEDRYNMFSQMVKTHGLREVEDPEWIASSATFAAARQDARRYYIDQWGEKHLFYELYQCFERFDDETFRREISAIVARLPVSEDIRALIMQAVPDLEQTHTRTLSIYDRKAARLGVLLGKMPRDTAIQVLNGLTEVLNLPPELNMGEVYESFRPLIRHQDDPNQYYIGKSIGKNEIVITVPEDLKMASIEELQADRLDVYRLINIAILNRPYPDVDDQIEVKLGDRTQTAFRPNHGTLHSMRQVMFVDYLMDLCNLTLSDEELEILKLASFLCRVGRTNERTHFYDPTYGRRSAMMFKICAEKIGCFSPQLIEKYTRLLSYQPDDSPEDNLALNILEMAHRIDLYRCWKLDKADAYLVEHIVKFLTHLPKGNPSKDMSQEGLLVRLRRLGCVANYVTGNRLRCFKDEGVDQHGIDADIRAFIANHRRLVATLSSEVTLSFNYHDRWFVTLTNDIFRTHELLEAVRGGLE